jgi:hypothetical protein
MTKRLAPLLLVLLLTATAFAQRTAPASKTELAEMTTRGRMLYDYDVAAWHSSDAVMALSPPEGRFNRYIARKTSSGWTVAYGKLNTAKDKFLIAYEAIEGTKPTEYKVTTFPTPKSDTGFYLFAARALEAGQRDLGATDRAYNAAVIPAPTQNFYVYLLPAQTKARVFPLGGDVRYRVSADGLKIVEKRRLHKSIIEFSVPKDKEIAMGFHSAVLDDAPEDTDVFHVLARDPKVPELVATSKYVYQINADGSINYLKTTEAFKKDGR